MSTCLLKIIAMVTMFGDHISYAIFGGSETTFLNYLGRFAMLIFCFQIALGYKKTHNLRKYLLRIFILALISQIPYNLFAQQVGFGNRLNVDFTLFLGLLAIAILNVHINKDKLSFDDENYKFYKYDSVKELILVALKFIFIFILCCLPTVIENAFGYSLEYGSAAILLIIFMYIFYPFDNNKKNLKILFYVLTIIVFGFAESQMWFGQSGMLLPIFYSSRDLVTYVLIYIFTIIGGLIPLFYNGLKGRSLKWITYFFYPVHLLIIYFICLFIH